MARGSPGPDCAAFRTPWMVSLPHPFTWRSTLKKRTAGQVSCGRRPSCSLLLGDVPVPGGGEGGSCARVCVGIGVLTHMLTFGLTALRGFVGLFVSTISHSLE